MLNGKNRIVLASCIATFGSSLPAFAAVVPIDQIGSPTGSPVADAWYYTEAPVAGATATIEAVPTGAGFNYGSHAATLTLPDTNAAKAEVGTFKDFGLATNVLRDIALSYQYYKTDTGSPNLAAAPALKLQIFAAGGTGDNFGALVYEPYFNSGGSVATNAWLTDAIDQNTGSGVDTNAGGWWWNGGFEVPNGAGGPPIRSLAEWATIFDGSDPDFANAHVVGLLMGEGSFNPNQVGYFDGVSISTLGGPTTTYDFVAPVPEPATTLFGLALIGAIGLGRRRTMTIAA